MFYRRNWKTSGSAQRLRICGNWLKIENILYAKLAPYTIDNSMRLIYISNARIPTEKAHGIQLMKMCEAFAQATEVELVIPRRINKIKDDPFDYYGLKRNFIIKKLPCLDLIPFHEYIGHLGLWIESLTFFTALFFYIIFRKADIIYARDRFILPLSLLKKNFILEAHSFPKKYFLYSLFLKRLKGIAVLTQKLKESFLAKGIMPNKILIAPDGIDLEMFDIQCSMSEARQKLGLPQDKKIVLYSGHLYEWKGAQTLAGASQYLPGGTEVYFVGGTTEDVRKFEIRNSKFETVHVVGYRQYGEIPYWLKAADVLVLPNSGQEDISKYWTSPLKMFEYMAAQRPIVAVALPSIREILNSKNSILVESDNPKELAMGINEALENRQLSDKISIKAFQDVQQYTWQARVKKILAFINK